MLALYCLPELARAHYCYFLPEDAPLVIRHTLALAYLHALQDYTNGLPLARGEVETLAARACDWLKRHCKALTNNPRHFFTLVTRFYTDMYLDQIARYQLEPSLYKRDRVALQSMTWQEACQRIQEQYQEMVFSAILNDD